MSREQKEIRKIFRNAFYCKELGNSLRFYDSKEHCVGIVNKEYDGTLKSIIYLDPQSDDRYYLRDNGNGSKIKCTNDLLDELVTAAGEFTPNKQEDYDEYDDLKSLIQGRNRNRKSEKPSVYDQLKKVSRRDINVKRPLPPSTRNRKSNPYSSILERVEKMTGTKRLRKR